MNIRPLNASLWETVLGDLNIRVGNEQVADVSGMCRVPGKNEDENELNGLCLEQELQVGLYMV